MVEENSIWRVEQLKPALDKNGLRKVSHDRMCIKREKCMCPEFVK